MHRAFFVVGSVTWKGLLQKVRCIPWILPFLTYLSALKTA